MSFLNCILPKRANNFNSGDISNQGLTLGYTVINSSLLCSLTLFY